MTSESDPFDHERIEREADLIASLRSIGAVDLDRPRKRYGFERRLERADRRPRTADGGYIGHLADYES